MQLVYGDGIGDAEVACPGLSPHAAGSGALGPAAGVVGHA